MKEGPEEAIPFTLYQHQICLGQTDVGGPGTTPSLTSSLVQQQDWGNQVYWPFTQFLPGADTSKLHCTNWMYSTKPDSALPTLLACSQHLNLHTCNLKPNPLGTALEGQALKHKTSGSIMDSNDDPKLTAKYLLVKKKAESESGALDQALEMVQKSSSPPVSYSSPVPLPLTIKFPLSPHSLCPSCPILLPIKPLSSMGTYLFTYGPHGPLLFLPSLDIPYPGRVDQMGFLDGTYSLGSHSPLQLEPWHTFSLPLPAGSWPTAEAKDESSSPFQCSATGSDSEVVGGKAGKISTLGTTALSYLLKKENGTILYMCNICAKGFRQLSNLKVHFRVHSGERPFQCPLCKKSFVQLAHLQKHQLVHSKKRPYQCPVCHKCFSSTNSHKTHLQLHSRAGHFLYRLSPNQPLGY